nr:MAG: hypothetical protein [Bacteriophage sp.]
MSKIVDKVFDAGKKIIRSVFLGSPNLFTTSDLNRQIEAIKYQLDSLDDKVGVYSDFEFSVQHGGSLLLVRMSISYVETKGCKFTPAPATLGIDFTSTASAVYVQLLADKETVTYQMDTTHDIAGAKFEDGTSSPAANQIIYKNEKLKLSHALTDDEGRLVAILGMFYLSNAGNVLWFPNFTAKNTPLAFRKSFVQDLDPSVKGNIRKGDSYDRAFSILENKLNNRITSNWTSFGYNDTVRYLIKNGTLYIKVNSRRIHYAVASNMQLAYFCNIMSLKYYKNTPSLFQYFKDLKIPAENLNTYDNINQTYAYFLPYGEIGSFPIFQGKHPQNSPVRPPRYSFAKVCLALVYNIEGELVDIQVGAYITHQMLIEDNNGSSATIYESGCNGLIPWNYYNDSVGKGEIIIPNLLGVFPLPGL